jgi:hypothetical protein
MARTFYTELDIEDLVRRGVSSLTVDEGTTLTDLARERAEKLGVELVRAGEGPSSAPQRPYLAAATQAAPVKPAPTKSDLKAQVRKSVLARLGDDVDPQLLDSIIGRVVDSL